MPPEIKRQRTAKDYVWRVFNNFANYALMGGVVASAVVSKQWWLLYVGAGAEALWMLYAPDFKWVRRSVEASFAEEDRAAAQRRRQDLLNQLSPEDRMRCRELMTKVAELEKLASFNPSFEGELLRSELTKLERLLESFIELSCSRGRFREYLSSEDVGEVERLAKTYAREAEDTEGSQRELAQKNHAVMLRRLERLREIQEFLGRSTGQLELIENSLGLLADQIVSMRSPEELGGQLDELIDGVDAVRETAREADRLLAPVSEAR